MSTIIRLADWVFGLALTSLVTCYQPKRTSGPLVSVVIATYNRPANLVLAIESVLRQSYRDFEILVVGDGCTDDTETVVKSISDSRVHWLSLSTNSGSQSMPNNLGIEQAKGKYIAYLGHDDIWLPNHLSNLVAAMEKGNLEIATTRCFSIGPPGSNVIYLSPPDLVRDQKIHTPPSALCHVRHLVKESGRWTDYKKLPPLYGPDTDFIDRFSQIATRKNALRRATVVKMNAAMRKNCYVSGDTSEQKNYLEETRRPLRLTQKLIYQTLLSRTLNRSKRNLEVDKLEMLPGEHLVDSWRRFKGLGVRNSE